MNRTHYHNTAAHPIYVGGVMIPAGASREVDARLVPGAAAATEEPEGEPPADPILALLDGNVAEVKAALPGLSDEDLDRLEAAEDNGKTRKGVLEAVAEERLARAQGGQQ